jgi:C4-dicarboxylate-specific signal transduction histidine kinase
MFKRNGPSSEKRRKTLDKQRGNRNLHAEGDRKLSTGRNRMRDIETRKRRQAQGSSSDATILARNKIQASPHSSEASPPALSEQEGPGGAGQVAVTLAHDLNQPLTAIAAYSQACLHLLRSDQADTQELAGALEQIAAQAEHAGRLVRTLRDQIVTGKMVRKPVQINTQIKEVLELCQHRIRREQVQLRTQLADSLPQLRGDPMHLEQVLLNLIHNAIEAMSQTPPGQRVLTISTTHEEGKIIVVVSDSGPGIDPGIARRLFQPFQTTKPHGMGLGLSLCHSIIEAHQGQIWMEPNPERGTTFIFSLPTELGQ